MQTKPTLRIKLLPLLAAAGIMTGCTSTNDRTAGRVIDDHAISSRVKKTLNHDAVYKYEDVDVRTFNGIVQLNGWADLPEQVERATTLARQTEGVNDVVNNISIKRTPTGRPPGYPYAQPGESPAPRVDPSRYPTNEPARPFPDAPPPTTEPEPEHK
jgi:hypothetical protein